MSNKKGHWIMAWILCGISLLPLGCSRSSKQEIAQAEAAYQKKDFSRAVALSESILQKEPASLPAHRLKALAEVAQGEIEGAFNDYDQVEKNHPDIAPALLREIALGIINHSLTHENYFVRSAAVKAIGEIGDPSQIPLIIPGLKDPAPFVRFFTVESLGQLGGPEALKLLLAMGEDPDGMVRVAVVKSLDDMAASKTGVPAGVDMNNILSTLVDDTEPTVKLFALAALTRSGDEQAFSQIVEIVPKLEGPARSAGAAALGRTKRREAAPLLTKMLADPDAPLRMYAAEAIGEIVAPESFAPLAKAIADPDAAVRGAAATSLGKLGDPKAIPLLDQAANDPDPIVRVSAAEGLQRLGKGAIPVYEAALGESDYAVRHFTVGSLRKVGGKEAIPLLKKALGDEAQRVRIAVVRALGEVGGPEAIPMLKESLKDPDSSVRTYAAGNVARLLNQAGEKMAKRGA
jgi:HEAT repeat protein